MMGTWCSQRWTPVGLSGLVILLGEEPRCPDAIKGHAVPSFGGGGGMGGPWLIGVTSCSCSQLGTAYVSATTGAVVTALGLKSLTKVRCLWAISGQDTWTPSPWGLPEL